ncbi:putative uncharacterized protein [Eshraghiella crossota CAG:259]|uniref:Uncharacterized protein n=1 Tax=Eshraghiella crossota CAG:259 TaxID=1263062 RepID=R5LR75_9FIRM|nr:putative uncharacterized protein [Butyrivibrio crossotus CAG:259]
MATPIDITGSVYDEATSTYTVHVPYDPEGKYELPEGVVMDTTDIESNETEDGIYNYAGYEDGVINYRTPGYVKVRLTAVRDDGYKVYTPVYLLIDIDESNETEDGIYNYAGYEEGVINYRTPGYVKARLTAVRDDGYRIYTPVYLLIDIDNTPEFRADNNKFYDNNVIIEKSGDLVAGVTLKNKKSWNGLNLSCKYDNSERIITNFMTIT